MNADLINLIAVVIVALVLGTASTGSFKAAIGLLVLFCVVAFIAGSTMLEAASALIFVSIVCFLVRVIGWLAIAAALACIAVYIMQRM